MLCAINISLCYEKEFDASKDFEGNVKALFVNSYTRVCQSACLKSVLISVRQILKFSSSLWTKKGFSNTNSNYCKVPFRASKNSCSLYIWLELIFSHSRFKFVFITCPILESNIAKAAKWPNIYSKRAFMLGRSRTRNNFSLPSFSVVGFWKRKYFRFTILPEWIQFRCLVFPVFFNPQSILTDLSLLYKRHEFKHVRTVLWVFRVWFARRSDAGF